MVLRRLSFSPSKRGPSFFCKEIKHLTGPHHPSIFLNCSNSEPRGGGNIKINCITTMGWHGELCSFKPKCDFKFNGKSTRFQARRSGSEPSLQNLLMHGFSHVASLSSSFFLSEPRNERSCSPTPQGCSRLK